MSKEFDYCVEVFNRMMEDSNTFPFENQYRFQMAEGMKSKNYQTLVAIVMNNEVLCDSRKYKRIPRTIGVVQEIYDWSELEVFINDCYKIYSSNPMKLDDNLARKAKREADRLEDNYLSLEAHFKLFLMDYPQWNRCMNPNCTTPHGTIVMDHVKPHEGNSELKLNWMNLQPLCYECNSYRGNSNQNSWKFSLDNKAYLVDLVRFMNKNLAANRYYFLA